MIEVPAACLDITGSDRGFDAVWADGAQRVHHVTLHGVEAAIEWVRDTRPQVLAVDAPSGRNRQRTQDEAVRTPHGLGNERSKTTRDENGRRSLKYWDFRLAEAILVNQGIGAYNTPADEGKVSEWIKRGWALYETLQHVHGYRLWNQPGVVGPLEGRFVLEVHPHACFVAGVGHEPHNKGTIAGSFERVGYLIRAAAGMGLALTGIWPGPDLFSRVSEALAGIASGDPRWRPDAIFEAGLQLPKSPHDVIDCLAGLITAYRAIRGQAYAVGDEAEGVIVLPNPLAQERYACCSDKKQAAKAAALAK